MSKTKVVVAGSSGRMGQEILGLLAEHPNLVASVGVASDETALVRKTVKSFRELQESEGTVVIDFSAPELFREALNWALVHKKPFVSGTTGITEADKAKLREAAQTIPVLWSANMSLGIALVAQMFKVFAGRDEFDYQIEELHHKRKKDAPSGTALALQEKLRAATEKNLPEPLAIRGGGIFGIHRIWAMSEEETITIEHTAMNRRVFARGAVVAADWLQDKSPGLYVMQDVLGLT